MNVVRFLKEWTLIISILSGIAGYFIYVSIPALDPTHVRATCGYAPGTDGYC